MEVFHFYTTNVLPCTNLNPRIPLGNNQADDDASPHMFRLKFHTREVTRITPINNNSGPPHGIPHEYTEELDYSDVQHINMHQDDLLSENGAYIMDDNMPTNSRPSRLSEILSDFGVPIDFQEGCINKIYNEAISMVQNPNYFDPRMLSMEVTITYVKHYVVRPRTQTIHTEIHFEEDIDDELLMELEEDHDHHHHQPELVDDTVTCRATESSIEALEKVPINTNSGLMNDECMICLENYGNGMEVRKLPCSHMYHEDCIKRWFARSVFCPTCRFAVPCVHHGNSVHE